MFKFRKDESPNKSTLFFSHASYCGVIPAGDFTQIWAGEKQPQKTTGEFLLLICLCLSPEAFPYQNCHKSLVSKDDFLQWGEIPPRNGAAFSAICSWFKQWIEQKTFLSSFTLPPSSSAWPENNAGFTHVNDAGCCPPFSSCNTTFTCIDCNDPRFLLLKSKKLFSHLLAEKELSSSIQTTGCSEHLFT